MCLLVLVTTSLAVAFSWPCCSTTAKGSDISAPLLDGTKMAKNRNPPRLIEGGGRGYDQNWSVSISWSFFMVSKPHRHHCWANNGLSLVNELQKIYCNFQICICSVLIFQRGKKIRSQRSLINTSPLKKKMIKTAYLAPVSPF